MKRVVDIFWGITGTIILVTLVMLVTLDAAGVFTLR